MNSQLQKIFEGITPINDKRTLTEFFKNVKSNVNNENYIELYKESVKFIRNPYYKYLFAISYISLLNKLPDEYNLAYLKILALDLKKIGLSSIPKSKFKLAVKKHNGKNGNTKSTAKNSIFNSLYKINSKPMKK